LDSSILYKSTADRAILIIYNLQTWDL